MSLPSFAVQAPVKVTMLFLAVLLLGWISLTRLPTNLFPDVQAPQITVTVRAVGLSPAEVERRICEVLERSLYTIRGVAGVRSIARTDSAVIVVNFDWETRMEFAFLEVKKATSELQRQRAQEIESVNVVRFDPNAEPVLTAALHAPQGADPEALYRTASQTLRPRFERLAGVANVALAGGMEREIVVELDESLLLTYELGVSNVVSALESENVDAPGGWVEEGARRFLLKASGRFKDIGDVERVVVGRRGDAPILLTDVGRAVLLPKEPTGIVELDGAPSVGMAFFREPNSNTVAVARAIRDEIEASAEVLPQGWAMTVANDQSLFISGAIREVRNNALLGGALAVLMLLVFLRDLRTTIIIAVAIPISIVATFNLMYFQGLTLNLMTLGGLALGCGMLVDNAIVVLENIFRLRERGHTPADAARHGAREVSGALIAATLTTVAVFLPIVYVRGVAGLLFKEQALTVVYSLLTSLLVALLLIPMLAAYFLGGSGTVPRGTPDAEQEVPRTLYTRLLSGALRVRWLVVLAAVGIFYLTVQWAMKLPQEFLPSTEVNQVGIRIVLPSGTPISSTEEAVHAITEQFERFGDAIERVYTRVGEQQGVVDPGTEDPDGPNTASILVTLRRGPSAEGPPLLSSRFIGEVKPILDRIEDAKVDFTTTQASIQDLIGGARAPLIIELAGQETSVLATLAGDVQSRLEQMPEAINVRTNILQGAPEILMQFDKTQLSRHGFEVQGIAGQIRQRLEGQVASTLRQDAGDVDLRVRMAYEREDVQTLRDMVLRSPGGALVRLDSLATFTESRAPREVVRQRQQRTAFVYADLAEGVRLSGAITATDAALEGLPLPPRYTLRITGEEQERSEAFGNLGFALLLSIVLVYMVMASIFESFLQPLLIMLTIPLAGAGIVLGLQLTGQSLNVMSVIGIVMLGGIVVNNAIVLLDCVNQVRARAPFLFSERDTLLAGCQRRFRPVLMTTGTTLLGLTPMAMGLGEGAELRQAMAITVLGGLFSSTLLTLFVIPCCQSYLDSARHLAYRWFGRRGISGHSEEAFPLAPDPR